MKFQWAYSEDSFDVWPQIHINILENESHYVSFEVMEGSPDGYNGAILKGSVKWDGCVNVGYGEDENGYMHHCGSQCMQEYFALVQCCYMLAQKLMEAQGQTYMSETPGCGYKDFKSQYFGFVRSVEVMEERT